jgi:hypothetical protein
MYIQFNSLAWQLYKLSHIFMQRYVIGAALPVGSVTIQHLEHIDGYYCKVATIKDQVSKFVRLVFYSDSVRFSLATYETSKRWYNKVRDGNTDWTFANNINYEQRLFTKIHF